MAPRRNRNRKSRPARRGRGRNRRGGNRVMKLPGTFAPQHMITTLKYVNTLGKTVPAGKIAAFNQFRLNSIWDPDYTNITGTSCFGLNEWKNMYQRYRVFKCAYKFTFSNLTADCILTGAVVPANYLDTTFSVSDYMRPLAKRFEIGNREGSNKTVVSGVINLPKLTGVSPVQYRTDDKNESGFTSSPSMGNYISLIMANSNASVGAYVVCHIELTYYVEMMSHQASVEAVTVSTGLPVVPEANFCT
jgi:hypothetical protein